MNFCGIVPWLLLITAQTLLQAEGRRTRVELSSRYEKGEGYERMVERMSMGSRPPRCEGMCLSCGRCEAVQVPVAPLHKDAPRFPAWFRLGRGDVGSDYKPLSWKCKCGSVIINP